MNPTNTESELPPSNRQSVSYLPCDSSDARLCFDFGTAMSKVTLVEGTYETEKITILKLGIPGNQEAISEHMLVSSVYIDNAGLLWFGQKAVELSMQKESHGRLDSIKKFLFEGNLEKLVPSEKNPTAEVVTYRHVILAYLMFLTWAAMNRLECLGYSRNIKRRFAMPCFNGTDDPRVTRVENRLKELLGEAQVLADVFCNNLENDRGIPLNMYLSEVKKLKDKNLRYDFIKESVTEPIGVANTFTTYDVNTARSMALIIDIGAGTCDMGIFFYWKDKDDNYMAGQVEKSSKTLKYAGDYIDSLLLDFIIYKDGIYNGKLDGNFLRDAVYLRIRQYKESLFEQKYVDIDLSMLENRTNIRIDLSEFLEMPEIIDFSIRIKSKMYTILKTINQSFIDAVRYPHHLAVLFTGGGARLPMIQKLQSESMNIKGVSITLEPGLSIPMWLEKDHPDISPIYSRAAVSLGGARKVLIEVLNDFGSTGVRALKRSRDEPFV